MYDTHLLNIEYDNNNISPIWSTKRKKKLKKKKKKNQTRQLNNKSISLGATPIVHLS